MFLLCSPTSSAAPISHSLPPGVSYIELICARHPRPSIDVPGQPDGGQACPDLKLGVIDHSVQCQMARSRGARRTHRRRLRPQRADHPDEYIIGYMMGFHFQAGFAQAIGWVALVGAARYRAELDLRLHRTDHPRRRGRSNRARMVLFRSCWRARCWYQVALPVGSAIGEVRPESPLAAAQAPAPWPSSRMPSSLAQRDRLDRAGPGRVHPASRVALPAHDLTQPTLQLRRGGVGRIPVRYHLHVLDRLRTRRRRGGPPSQLPPGRAGRGGGRAMAVELNSAPD